LGILWEIWIPASAGMTLRSQFSPILNRHYLIVLFEKTQVMPAFESASIAYSVITKNANASPLRRIDHHLDCKGGANAGHDDEVAISAKIDDKSLCPVARL